MANDVDTHGTGLRARMRRTPGGAQLLKVLVFLAGLVCILIGGALVVLPGPLTIPPILLGVYLWSTEFAWAHRLRLRAEKSARQAWKQAKARPVVSALITGGGIVAAVVVVVVVQHYDLVGKLLSAVGL